MTEIISKIDKYATEIKKMLDTLDAKTEVQYYCEFGNEKLEELLLEKLEDISIIDDDGEEKYLLGNVDTLIEEFFAHPEVIKERLQFFDEDEDDDEDEQSDVDEESEDNKDEKIDDEGEEIDVSSPFDDQDDELCELNSDLEDSELEEDKNYINFYIQLKDERYININYTPQFDENFNIIGVVRDITLEI